MAQGKLVRDRIPEIIRRNGETPVTRTATEGEYMQMLREKLMEETGEFLREEKTEELADILEVILAICDFRGIDSQGLELLRKSKAEERGGFRNRTILEGTE